MEAVDTASAPRPDCGSDDTALPCSVGTADVETAGCGSCALGDGSVSGCDGGPRDAGANRPGLSDPGVVYAVWFQRQALCGGDDPRA